MLHRVKQTLNTVLYYHVIQHDETWCISKVKRCRSWLTNHKGKKRSTNQITGYVARRLQTATEYASPKVFIFVNAILNQPSQFMHQYFIPPIFCVWYIVNVKSLTLCT